MTAVVWGGETGAGLDVGCGEGEGGTQDGLRVPGGGQSLQGSQDPGARVGGRS